MHWVILPLRKYADFTGRARRREYWSFVLPAIVVAFLIGLVEARLGLSGMIGPYGPLTALFELAILVPMVAVGIRRLHDTDRSGLWILLGIVPSLALLLPYLGISLVGAWMVLLLGSLAALILLLLFMVMEGTKGPNRFGPDPKAGA